MVYDYDNWKILKNKIKTQQVCKDKGKKNGKIVQRKYNPPGKRISIKQFSDSVLQRLRYFDIFYEHGLKVLRGKTIQKLTPQLLDIHTILRSFEQSGI